MKKLKEQRDKIPRPCRAITNLALALVIAIVFYVSIGSPPFSRAHQFRRTERANLVGPSTILFNDSVENYEYSYLIVAETEHGVLTFATDDTWPTRFHYCKKTGDITVVSAPDGPFYWGETYFSFRLPVFVIDDHPEAIRAELEVSINGTLERKVNGVKYVETLDQHFSDKSERGNDGIFCFSFDLPYIDPLDEYGNWIDVGHGADGFALDELASTFSDHTFKTPTSTITAVVRLYDASGTLIAEREQVLSPDPQYWE